MHGGFGHVLVVRVADCHGVEQRDAERGVGRLPYREAGVVLRQREGGVVRPPNPSRIQKARSVEAARAVEGDLLLLCPHVECYLEFDSAVMYPISPLNWPDVQGERDGEVRPDLSRRRVRVVRRRKTWSREPWSCPAAVWTRHNLHGRPGALERAQQDQDGEHRQAPLERGPRASSFASAAVLLARVHVAVSLRREGQRPQILHPRLRVRERGGGFQRPVEGRAQVALYDDRGL